jgi:hypothetical protein
MPWMNRRVTKRIGAHTPICWWVGRQPTAKVPSAMIPMVIISMTLRPMRSPK